MGQFQQYERATIPWLSVAGAILASLTLTVAVTSPNAPILIAVFPPWWDGASAFSAAASAGDPVRVGRLSTIFLVSGHKSRLATKLCDAGARPLMTAGPFDGCTQAKG